MHNLLYKENGRYVYATPWGEYVLDDMTYSQNKAVGLSFLVIIIMLATTLADATVVI